jgi:UDP-N-acetylglucosamine acyltransferase
MKIHLTAIVHPGAEIPDDIEIGPYCIIGEKVRLGARNRLIANVIIDGSVTVGDDNVFFPFSSIGSPPQDLKYRGEETRVEIGHRNQIREFVTINRGTKGGGMLTHIGDDNLFMAYTHVAHDCFVGNQVIFGNATTLAGHVHVADGAIVAAFSGVLQFCRIGIQAFVGGYSVITRDALPYIKSVGIRSEAKTYGINTVGLERRNMPAERIAALKQAYRHLFQSQRLVSEAIAQLRQEKELTPEVETLVQFIETAKRGFIR